MKPMLSATFTPEWAPRLRFPLMVSPKLDGFRAVVLEDGRLYSKNLTLIRKPEKPKRSPVLNLKLSQQKYRYGFVTEIEEDKVPRGLSEVHRGVGEFRVTGDGRVFLMEIAARAAGGSALSSLIAGARSNW